MTQKISVPKYDRSRMAISGEEEPHRYQVQPDYDRLEARAAFLLDGWDNVMGTTPDDLAQVATWHYLDLMEQEGLPADEAIKVASFRIQQNVRDLYQKDANNPATYFEEVAQEDPEDPEDDPGEESLAAVEASWIYFPPDFLDTVSALLTPRETDVILAMFEDDLTQEKAAKKLQISERRVRQLLHSAIEKLRVGLSDNE